jgi:hypothetical protein
LWLQFPSQRNTAAGMPVAAVISAAVVSVAIAVSVEAVLQATREPHMPSAERDLADSQAVPLRLATMGGVRLLRGAHSAGSAETILA